MLNSIVAMRGKAILCLILYLIVIFSLIGATSYQVSIDAIIQSPLPGEAVQGLVQIKGSIQVDGFSSYKLAFSFGNDVTETWFLINENQSPISEGVLGEWDTSVLSDGNYSLRLIVYRIEKDPVVVIVEGIRVRNYSPIETNTPSKSSVSITPTQIDNSPTTQGPKNTNTPFLSPTPLPKNPAEINPKEIYSTFLKGAFTAVILLGILCVYKFTRNRM